MASKPQIDDDDDFGGDYPENRKRSGDKRAFGDLEEEEDDDVFGSKKGKKAEESGPGAATGMILSLRESLQNCKDNLAKCQAELEDAQSEIWKWHSAFQNDPAAPYGANPEPALAITYLQNLKSLEESLKEKLEKAKKREAAFIVTYAKREQEIADLKSAVRDLKKQLRPPSIQTQRLLLDPAIHEEFTRLKNLVEDKEKKVKELQDNVAAVNFSANSRMGKMLMAKCRTLQEENEEIGAMASEGKLLAYYATSLWCEHQVAGFDLYVHPFARVSACISPSLPICTSNSFRLNESHLKYIKSHLKYIKFHNVSVR